MTFSALGRLSMSYAPGSSFVYIKKITQREKNKKQKNRHTDKETKRQRQTDRQRICVPWTICNKFRFRWIARSNARLDWQGWWGSHSPTYLSISWPAAVTRFIENDPMSIQNPTPPISTSVTLVTASWLISKNGPSLTRPVLKRSSVTSPVDPFQLPQSF